MTEAHKWNSINYGAYFVFLLSLPFECLPKMNIFLSRIDYNWSVIGSIEIEWDWMLHLIGYFCFYCEIHCSCVINVKSFRWSVAEWFMQFSTNILQCAHLHHHISRRWHNMQSIYYLSTKVFFSLFLSISLISVLKCNLSAECGRDR